MSIRQIRYPGVGTGNGGERYEFRRVVLASIGRLTPRWTAQIHALVDEAWGGCCRRRVQRALRWLRINGRVERTADGYLLAREARRA